jgi:hypothetical protein
MQFEITDSNGKIQTFTDSNPTEFFKHVSTKKVFKHISRYYGVYRRTTSIVG